MPLPKLLSLSVSRFPRAQSTLSAIRDWMWPSSVRAASTWGGEIRCWVDFTCEFDLNPGIQRVTRSLARGLEELGHSITYLAWSDSEQAPRSCTRRQLRNLSRWNGPSHRRVRGQINSRLGIDAQRGGWLLVPELTYWRMRNGRQEPWNSDPMVMLLQYARAHNLKTAFLFYDLIPIRFPSYAILKQLHERYVKQLAHADLILPISRFAGSDLMQYFAEIRGDTVPEITPLLLAEEFLGFLCAMIREPPRSGPVTIMCVGRVEPRKNQVRLIEAFNLFCDEQPTVDVRLYLVGTISDESRDEIIAISRRNRRIELMGPMADSQMVDLYGRCHFTAFPSIAEGYGLPIVESLWLGRPCLCANFGAMAEVAAGGGCLTVDTRSVSAIKKGLARMILDPTLRESLAADAIGRPMSTWRDYAAGLLAILRSETSGAPPIPIGN